ncbi:MAG: FecR domain-containing protein [Spirochaetales bacterium]|nr:FecR domain-containing protein [Spirochaetales bacterium]
MRKVSLFIASLVFFAGFGVLYAENIAGVRIVWIDSPLELIAYDRDSVPIRADVGTILRPGARLETKETTVELQLLPRGGSILIAPNTHFLINSIEENKNQMKTDFSLSRGKVRLIIDKTAGSRHLLRTPTTVAGVRGTDFYRMYDRENKKDWLCVTEGAVQFDSLTGEGGLLVSAGYFVNLAKGFAQEKPSEEWLKLNLTLKSSLERSGTAP